MITKGGKTSPPPLLRTNTATLKALHSILPKSYNASTTAAERAEHLELYRKFAGGSEVLLSWVPPSKHAMEHGSTTTILYAVFRDAVGSLSTISSTLSEGGINLLRVSAFVTSSGVAIDTFELSALDTVHAELMADRLEERIRSSIKSLVAGAPPPVQTPIALHGSGGGTDELIRQLPPDYATSTTPADRLVHLELYRRLIASGGDALISWGPVRDGTPHVVLHVVFRDCLGSLETITHAIHAQGINVLRVAAYSTTQLDDGSAACGTAGGGGNGGGGAGGGGNGGGGGGSGGAGGGIAVDTFRLSTFDRAAAKLLRQRLSEKLGEYADSIPELLPLDASDVEAAVLSGAVRFRASWTG